MIVLPASWFRNSVNQVSPICIRDSHPSLSVDVNAEIAEKKIKFRRTRMRFGEMHFSLVTTLVSSRLFA